MINKITIVKASRPETAKKDIWTVTVFNKSTIEAVAKQGGMATNLLGKMGFFGAGSEAPEATVKEMIRNTFTNSDMAIKIYVKQLEAKGKVVKVEQIDESLLHGVPVYRDNNGFCFVKQIKGKFDDINEWMSGKKKESDY